MIAARKVSWRCASNGPERARVASCLGQRRRAGASSRAFAPCEGAATKRKVEGSRPPQGRWRHSGAWGPLPQCRALAKGRKPRECLAPFFLRQRTIPARALVRQALAHVEATVAPRTVPKPRDAALRMRERERGAAGSWPRRRRHGAHFALTRRNASSNPNAILVGSREKDATHI